MLIVDTGPLVAYLNRNDPDHDRCAALPESRTDDLLVTPYVVTEACYLVGKYVGAVAEINLIEALVAGDLGQIDITAADLNRIAELMRQYMGSPSASPTLPSSRPPNGSGSPR
jgi:predicted nucleic acid-binding protein